MLRTTEHVIHNWKWFVFIVFMAVLTAGLPMRSLAADTGQDAGTEAEADTEQGTGTAAEAEAQQGAGTEAATDTEEPLLMIRVEGRFEEPDRDALIDCSFLAMNYLKSTLVVRESADLAYTHMYIDHSEM